MTKNVVVEAEPVDIDIDAGSSPVKTLIAANAKKIKTLKKNGYPFHTIVAQAENPHLAGYQPAGIFGTNPFDGKNSVKDLASYKLQEYEQIVNNTKKQIFDFLGILKKNKEAEANLRKLVDVKFVELEKFTTTDDVVLGNYINADKLFAEMCSCQAKKTCKKLHLEDDSKWIRLNHSIYVYVGTNE